MFEFRNLQWSGGIVNYNYSPDNDPSKIRPASACLTNGCTNHMGSPRNGNANYYLWLRRDLTGISSDRAFWCPFTLGQIIMTLDDINEVVPIKYEIEETPDLFKIHLEISMKEFCSRVHFYVLTRVRYLYEYPQCVLYKDTLDLYNMEEFNGWSLSEIYALVVDSIPSVSNRALSHIPRNNWYDCYHSIPKSDRYGMNERMDNKTLKEKISSLRMGYLNNILRRTTKIPVKIPFEEEFFNSLVFWKEKLGFDYRLRYYLVNKKILESPDRYCPDEYSKKDLEDFDIKGLEKELKALDKNIVIPSREDSVRVWSKDSEEQMKFFRELYSVYSKNVINFNYVHPRDSHGRFIKRTYSIV